MNESDPPNPADASRSQDDARDASAHEPSEDAPVRDPNEPYPRPVYLCDALRMRDGQIPDLADDVFMERVHPFTHYYCAKTLEPLGPDDLPAIPEECTPERPCFELSIHSPARPDRDPSGS